MHEPHVYRLHFPPHIRHVMMANKQNTCCRLACTRIYRTHHVRVNLCICKFTDKLWSSNLFHVHNSEHRHPARWSVIVFRVRLLRLFVSVVLGISCLKID